MTKRERQYKAILVGELTRGKSPKTAKRIAAATVNKTRARLAKKGGTKLVGEGGGRQQWYPGKATAMAKKVLVEAEKKIGSKAPDSDIAVGYIVKRAEKIRRQGETMKRAMERALYCWLKRFMPKQYRTLIKGSKKRCA